MKANKGNVKAFFKILKYLKFYRLHFILSLVFTAISVALTLYVPILVGQAIDQAISKGAVDHEAIYLILIKIGASVMITALLQWLINVLNNRMTYGIVRNIRHEAFVKLQSFPVSYIDSRTTGEVVSRIITDTDQFADGLLLGFTQFFSSIITIVGTLLFMFVINVPITLLVVLLTPLSFFVASFIAKRTYSMFKLQSEIRGEQTSLIDEAISGHKLVLAFNREKFAIDDFNEINDRLGKASVKAIFFSSITNPSTRFVNA
ncbi:MAG: ABC transporter ATP-binding protein, partial [Ruminococcaceae bacterium]|nr:ABC transporter ATP-binding protein [Oscillospiraceae bacterium]